MEPEIKTWLADIRQAVAEIRLFLTDTSDFKAFQQDLKTKRAIERNLEIIGEALNRIVKTHPEIPITNVRKIIDTRNRIIHGYDSVSEEIIWAIVVRELKTLEAEVEELLRK